MRYLPTNIICVALTACGLAFGLSACTPQQENAVLGAADAIVPIGCQLLPAAQQAACVAKGSVATTVGGILVGAQAAAQ